MKSEAMKRYMAGEIGPGEYTQGVREKAEADVRHIIEQQVVVHSAADEQRESRLRRISNRVLGIF